MYVSRKITIGFVYNRAFDEYRKFNPFNFKHFNINYLSLYADRVQIPSEPLQPRFTDSNPIFIECYHTIFFGTGIHVLIESLAITRTDCRKGYCFLAFDLKPDPSANSAFHWNLIKRDSVCVKVKFEPALASTINCMIFAEYDNVFKIDASRQIITDLNA